MILKAKSTVEPFISVSATPKAAPARSRTTRTVDHVPDDFDRMTDILRDDITHFVNAGLYLRAEMESLIIWENRSGKNVPTSTNWGEVQIQTSEHCRTVLRAKAAQLKSEIEAECKNPAWVLDHYIFNPKHRIREEYGPEITEHARKELGF